MNKNLFIYVFSLILFGSNGVWASFIHLKSYETVFFRTFLGMIFLGCVYLISSNKQRFWEHKRDVIITSASGIAMGLNWLLLFEAYEYVGVGIATLCCYCGPILVIIISAKIFNTQITKSNGIGILIVMIGLVMVSGLGKITVNVTGLILGILSAAMYAMMILTSRNVKSLQGIELTLIQLFSCCLLVSAVVFIKDGMNINVLKGDVLPIMVLGVINTGMGCFLFARSIRKLRVQTVSVCGYLEPLSAVFFSVIFLHEALKSVQIIGAVLIIGGALIGESRKMLITTKK